jgi:NADH-quinone oxidoreductase subunit M
MLEFIFFFLLLGGIHLILIPRDYNVRLKKAALSWSLIILAVTILLWVSFDGDGEFQAAMKLRWFSEVEPIFGPVVFAVDGVSIFFLILTALLVPICVLIS